MGHFNTKRINFTLLLLLLLPLPARAITAITCHCFTDRSYDPMHPTLADPYFLATTQNSFFAVVFGIDKKTIVMKKQQGAASDDLWIAYWMAPTVGMSPELLLQKRQVKDSWSQAATQLGLYVKPLGDRFSAALKANASDARIAETVVDDLLLHYRFYGEVELAALRKAGAGNQELVIIALIAGKTRQKPSQIYREVKSGTASWGGLLQRANISPHDIQAEVTAMVR